MERVSAIEELTPAPPAAPAPGLARRLAAFVRSPIALDVAPTVALAALAFAETWPSHLHAPVNYLVWSDVLRHIGLVLGLSVPLALRRRFPVAVLLVVVLVVVLGASQMSAGVIALAIALFSVGLYAKNRARSLAGLGAVFTIFLVVWGLTAAPDELSWNLFAISTVAAVWLTGDALRGRTQRAEAMERRAAELERDRAEDLRRATAAERARIARELHDVIAHNLSVVVIQAGAALRVQDDQPDAAREALRQVEATGRQAMTEMRRLLGVLRRDGDEDADEALTEPQPGMAALPALLDEIRAAGLAVTLSDEGEPRALPPGVDVSVYRIVQEALTNVLRHANAIRADVQIRYLPRAVEIAVVDDGRGSPRTGASTGHGLAGMRERADLFGGTFEAGPRPEGGFAVRVSLPTGAGPG